jgi:FkbM family methyltransferase
MATGLNLLKLKHELGFEPRTILDVGAQIGDFYRECKQTWPDSQVMMIEATQECEPYLKDTGGNYLIAVLSDEKKTIPFYKTKLAETNTGNSVYRELTSAYSDDNLIVEDRETTTLDELYDGYTTVFDLIKLDTQGSELDIMNGGSRLLKNTAVIILEVSHVEYNEKAPLVDEVKKYMENIGFIYNMEIGQSYSNDFQTSDGIIQKDLVFVNKEFVYA